MSHHFVKLWFLILWWVIIHLYHIPHCWRWLLSPIFQRLLACRRIISKWIRAFFIELWSFISYLSDSIWTYFFLYLYHNLLKFFFFLQFIVTIHFLTVIRFCTLWYLFLRWLLFTSITWIHGEIILMMLLSIIMRVNNLLQRIQRLIYLNRTWSTMLNRWQ